MKDNFEYAEDFPGKMIKDIGMDNTNKLLSKMKNKT